jgi:hypothetical protein
MILGNDILDYLEKYRGFHASFSIVAMSFAMATSFAADAIQPIVAELAVAPHISGYGEIYPADSNLMVTARSGRWRIFAPTFHLRPLECPVRRIVSWGFRKRMALAAVHVYYRTDHYAAGLFATAKIRREHRWRPRIQSSDPLGLRHITLYGMAQFMK